MPGGSLGAVLRSPGLGTSYQVTTDDGRSPRLVNPSGGSPTSTKASAPRHRAPGPARLSRGSKARLRTGIVAWTLTPALPPLAAYAYWTASGSGPGSGHSQTAQALTVTGGTASADLYPGKTGVVVFSVTNPNTYGVSVTGATISSVSGISGAAGSCAASDFTLGTGTVNATSIAAGATVTVTLNGALTMKTTAGDGCQGAVVSLGGAVSGTQV